MELIPVHDDEPLVFFLGGVPHAPLGWPSRISEGYIWLVRLEAGDSPPLPGGLRPLPRGTGRLTECLGLTLTPEEVAALGRLSPYIEIGSPLSSRRPARCSRSSQEAEEREVERNLSNRLAVPPARGSMGNEGRPIRVGRVKLYIEARCISRSPSVNGSRRFMPSCTRPRRGAPDTCNLNLAADHSVSQCRRARLPLPRRARRKSTSSATEHYAFALTTGPTTPRSRGHRQIQPRHEREPQPHKYRFPTRAADSLLCLRRSEADIFTTDPAPLLAITSRTSSIGACRPRMSAQYADKHRGVCLSFRKFTYSRQ